jgi:uncharacterized protein YggU (UPF0235/DUF167 family)
MQLIKVRVITKAKMNKVKQDGKNFKIYTSACPEKNKANKSIRELLADYLDKKPSQISIVEGLHSKLKTIQIN